ncbi:ankyrin repeat-containing domain protein [Immersiella caudata]|uniref:Ankyrin repeat-containing domain protein n=1 Tax=Immersiella caudata TaxID=314043 RepID=A0AA40CBV2_9PEZI|nr:ankyrin repeat-containing domain protein [Immersiella caudata]
MSDSEESSSSEDSRDLEEDSGLDEEVVDAAEQPPPAASNPAEPEGDEKEDEAKDAKGEEGETQLSPESAPPQFGLIPESSTGQDWQTFDIVVVHGIHETSWNNSNWIDGYKPATWWISSLGLYSGRLLHFHYDIKGSPGDRPDVLCYGGIERQAQKLVDNLLKIRQQHQIDLGEDYLDSEPPSRSIIFVAHDIGGIIVKRALTIASLNPSKYGNIPFDTTNLMFLGCPHRNNRGVLEDQLAKLLLLTENSFVDRTIDAINGLVRTIHQVNEEFLDTKILLHASVFNIVNRGIGDDDNHIGLPFKVLKCYYNLPYEYSKETSISHLQLADGDSTAENDWDKFVDPISKMMGLFPFYITNVDSVAQIQKTFLSMSPPALPPLSMDYGWSPYAVNPWISETDQYKGWKKQRTLSILHIRGPSQMRIRSDKFWEWILYDTAEDIDDPTKRNTAYFAFSRNDARFNTVERLLTFMIASIVGRNQNIEGIRPIYDMLRNQRAWTTKDLVHTLLACHDSLAIQPMTFMIACLEQCDESVYLLLRLFAGLISMSEKPFKFILTSTTGVNEQLDRELAVWPTIDLAEYPVTGQEWPFAFESRFGTDMRRLTERKPAYVGLQEQVKEWLAQFGPEDRLGDYILSWLITGKQDNSKAGIKKTLAALAKPTFDSFLGHIIATFGPREQRARDLLTWATFAFEPLTTFELAIAVELSQGTTEEDLEDIFLDDFQDDVKQFSLLFAYRGHEVKFWHVLDGMRKPPTPEDAAAAHGELARLCLRYLRFPQVMQKIKGLCESHNSLDLDQPPPMRPRNDLISYAVLYWPRHYALATGSNRPKEEALGLLRDKPCRTAWWSARYVLSNHVARLNRGYLSPLPAAAMTGLDDLVEALLEDDKAKWDFSANVGMALVEAVRAGHISTAKLLLETSKPGRDDLRDAISAAASLGDRNTLKRLIELGLEVQGFIWPAGLMSRIAWLGFVDSAELLLNGGVQIPESGQTFETLPLHIAIQARHKSMVTLLLRANCDPKGLDESGNPALARAASQGCPEIVRTLLAAGASTEIESEHGLKPVQLAVRHARPLALRALLEGGADREVGVDHPVDDTSLPTLEDRTDAKPLPLAAMNGYTECVRALLDHGADLKATLGGKSAVWHASYRGYHEIVRLLLQKGADPNEKPEGDDHTLVAVIGSDLDSGVMMDVVRLLIEHGARVDQQDAAGTWRSNPLSRAAGKGNKELVQLLLDKGAPPNIGNGATDIPLYVAAYEGNEEILKVLIERGADVNIPGTWDWTPLHASYDHFDIVKTLLENGAEINSLSKTGTVTYLASKHNQDDTLRVLLSHSTKPNLELETTFGEGLNLDEFEDGMTPLCIACKNGHVNIIRLLLQNGADADHRTKDGSFPLEFCLDTNGGEPAAVMEALLEFRPNLEMADDHGNTVLHNISNRTDVAVVKMLYTAGAQINVINKEGKSPLALAVEAENTAVAKFLIEKNATADIYSPEKGTILNAMVEAGQWEVFEAAAKAGANVHLAHENGYKETLLHAAMSGYWGEDRENIVRYLLQTAKVNPNQRCNDTLYCYPLIKCAYLQSAQAIQLLLDNGADPNVEDKQGRRAVHMAAFRYWELMEPLLAKGADAMARDKAGMTPLHFSAASGSYFTEFFENIQKHLKGENETTGDSSTGETTGDEAAPKTALKVKSNGVHPEIDVNDKDADGWTLLMWLSKGSYSAYLEVQNIIERGADLWCTAPALDIFGNDREWSPLKAARYYGSSEMLYDVLAPKEKTRTKPDGTKEEWDDDRHAMRTAIYNANWTCDHCMMNIVGLNWKCRECAFNLCYKCARTSKFVHPGHEFEPEGPEFEPLPETTPDPSDGPAEDARTPAAGNGGHEEEDDDSDGDDDEDDDTNTSSESDGVASDLD